MCTSPNVQQLPCHFKSVMRTLSCACALRYASLLLLNSASTLQQVCMPCMPILSLAVYKFLLAVL